MGIYVWGIGCGASELIEQGLPVDRITAFVDSYPLVDIFLGKPVLLPEKLKIEDCDLMIISARQAEAIAHRIHLLGLPAEKCLFIKNYGLIRNRNEKCAVAEEILGRELMSRLLPKQRMISTPPQLTNSILSERELENDYVRLATLELLCGRLTDIPGAAAELGVYRGHFAKCINSLLPERKLYLFDSFEGFMPEAGATDSFQAAHQNTNAENVLAIMPYPEQVIMKPGFFPDSLNGLEERFCLVSLDVDFENTTMDGLRYFWPRLHEGGYLMLHDWGNPKLPGVKHALKQYELEIGRKIPAVPLCDVGGTLILYKIY